MSTSVPDPVPQRIGDAERDQAAEFLREHLAAGRLTSEEFDERLTRALTAKTARDLAPLFLDLPAPRPGNAVPVPPRGNAPYGRTPRGVAGRRTTAPPASQRASKVLGVLSAVAWPLILLLLFSIGWEYWFLIFIPIALSSAAGSLSGKPTRNRGELEQ